MVWTTDSTLISAGARRTRTSIADSARLNVPSSTRSATEVGDDAVAEVTSPVVHSLDRLGLTGSISGVSRRRAAARPGTVLVAGGNPGCPSQTSGSGARSPVLGMELPRAFIIRDTVTGLSGRGVRCPWLSYRLAPVQKDQMKGGAWPLEEALDSATGHAD